MAKKSKIIVDHVFHQEFKHIHLSSTDKYLQGLVKRNAKFIAEQNKMEQIINWLKIRDKWVEKLKDSDFPHEFRVLKFLQKEETKNYEYYETAVKEMKEMCSNPSENYKYFWFNDIELMEHILNDFAANVS